MIYSKKKDNAFLRTSGKRLAKLHIDYQAYSKEQAYDKDTEEGNMKNT